MADIDAIHLPAADESVQLTQSTLYALAELVRRHETIYKQAGAVHGCALFNTQPELLCTSSRMSAATTPWMRSPG